MSHATCGLKALGLSFLVALSLMAFAASGAQAVAEMKVSGSKLVTNETLEGVAVSPYLATIPGQKLEIHCKTVNTHWIWLSGDWWFERQHLLSGCETLQNGKAVVACNPINQPVVFSAIALPILHNNVTYLLMEPEAGGVFGTMQFNSETCALAEDTEITGSYVLECLTAGGVSGNCNEELATHNVRPASTALFSKDALSFGENPMTITGTEAVKMSGANEGLKWSVTI